MFSPMHRNMHQATIKFITARLLLYGTAIIAIGESIILIIAIPGTCEDLTIQNDDTRSIIHVIVHEQKPGM